MQDPTIPKEALESRDNPIVLKYQRYMSEYERTSKLKELYEYLQQFKDLPQQGTAEWVESRGGTVGGSEIPTVAGMNKYSTIEELIKAKLGIDKVPDWFLPFIWGHLFEEVVNKTMEFKLGVEIETAIGALPGIIDKQTYSPDGTTVVSRRALCRLLNRENLDDFIPPEGEFVTVLMEYKAPIYKPVKPGEPVPEHYLPQVKTGLDTIRLCQMALFAQMEIVMCGTSTAVSMYGKHAGIIGVYSDENTEFNKAYFAQLFNVDIEELGAEFSFEFLADQFRTFREHDVLNDCLVNFMYSAKKTEMKVHYIEPISIEETDREYAMEKQHRDLVNYGKRQNYAMLGFLPYYIKNINIVPVAPEYGYVEQFKERVNFVVRTARRARRLETEEEQREFVINEIKRKPNMNDFYQRQKAIMNDTNKKQQSYKERRKAWGNRGRIVVSAESRQKAINMARRGPDYMGVEVIEEHITPTLEERLAIRNRKRSICKAQKLAESIPSDIDNLIRIVANSFDFMD
jgi:hypothetical protein